MDADGSIEVTGPAIGIKDAIPVVGDFRGDGVRNSDSTSTANGSSTSTATATGMPATLWAKLGTRDDQPVVGDWDGDGKDDIGIFGPAWPRDPKADRGRSRACPIR